jgi:hypothetical protein
VLLAELEIHHSRPIAPTRRVALGRRDLPFEPPPGYGAVLLGGIAARFAGDLDPELFDELDVLIRQLEAGRRITQPRLRHRFQTDRVGLLKSRHLLVRDAAGVVAFDLETDKGSPAQYVLGAVYAAGEAPPGVRRQVMDAIRRGLVWRGPIDVNLAAHLVAGGKVGRIASGDPIGWALDVLGFAHEAGRPPRSEVLARYRLLLRDAHPDHGGETADAADRIADLTTARRILLETV